MGRVWLFDIQGWITLFIGGLLALITFFSSYSYVSIPFGGTAQINQQIGVLLLAALVPPLLGVDEVFSKGVVELATRRRLRAERDRVREAEDRARGENEASAERIRAARERNRADRERNRAARRAQLQNRSHVGFSEGVALLFSSSTNSSPPRNTQGSSEA